MIGKERIKRKKRMKGKESKGRKERTSRPKARDGLRYPCPVKWFMEGSLLSKQGFGPKGGRSPVEHRGNLYVSASSPERLFRLSWGPDRSGQTFWRLSPSF